MCTSFDSKSRVISRGSMVFETKTKTKTKQVWTIKFCMSVAMFRFLNTTISAIKCFM